MCFPNHFTLLIVVLSNVEFLHCFVNVIGFFHLYFKACLILALLHATTLAGDFRLSIKLSTKQSKIQQTQLSFLQLMLIVISGTVFPI